jgi:hypothetical protein
MQKSNYLFLILLAVLFSSISVYSQFGGGNGSEQNPFQIYNITHLQQLATNVNNGNNYYGMYFILLNDIDDSLRTCIGNFYHQFSGSFDGQNFKIMLAINLYSGMYIGLFGYTEYANISNLSVDGYVNGRSYVGGICGIAYYTTISNCINYASITGDDYVAGIIGSGYQTNISSCANYGNIQGTGTADGHTGGINGVIHDGEITNCSNAGTIKGIIHIAGISPCINNTIVSDCNNIGNVEGEVGVSGIAANELYRNNTSTIIRCKNHGYIKSAGVVGGICGEALHGIINITDCENTGVLEGLTKYPLGPP